jgi:AraC-like DNA-binding protein
MTDTTQSTSITPELPIGMQLLASGSIRFTLDGVPPSDRMAVYREVFGRSVMNYDLEPLPDIPFDVDLKFQALPGLLMMSGRVCGSRNTRTRETLAREGTDDIGMLINLVGPHRVTYGQRELVLGDGEATLVSMSEVCSFTHKPPGEVLAFRVPRKLFAPLTCDVDSHFLQRIPSCLPALRLLTDYVRLAQGSSYAMDADLQRLFVTHVHELMAAVVGASRDAAEITQARGLKAAKLQAIKEDIAHNIHEAGLTVAALADRHRCTPRFLQRLFEAEGTTFTDYVLKQRLARAHRMLTDPRHIADKISSIAFDAGFADLSYFNRAFRQHYGDTPSSIRSGMSIN